MATLDELADALVEELNRYEAGPGHDLVHDVLAGARFATVVDLGDSTIGFTRPRGRWVLVLRDAEQGTSALVVGQARSTWRRGDVTDVTSDRLRAELAATIVRPARASVGSSAIWPPPPGAPAGTTPHGPSAPDPEAPPLASLPGNGLLTWLTWTALSIVASLALGIATLPVGNETLTLVAGTVGQSGTMLYACIRRSRRVGTGSLREDLGLAFRWTDLPLGLVALFAANLVGGALSTPLVPDHPAPSNTEQFVGGHTDLPYLAILAVIVIVVAPVVEELFFRGLVLRTLLNRMRSGWAVVVQATLFAVAHADFGVSLRDNLVVFVQIGAFGLILGYAAVDKRRLGVGIVAHAMKNALAISIVYATL